MGERLYIGARALVVLGVAALITLFAIPAPMRSLAWTPPRAPNFEGPFLPNRALMRADRLAPGELVGPETVAVDDAGRIYSGTTDGKIVRMIPGQRVEVFTETGGRPLGMAFVKHDGATGDLIVADVIKGLLRVDTSGAVEVLAHECEGDPLIFANAVAVSDDGHTVYLTDSSAHWGYGEHVNDLLEANPTGRVIRFDLKTRTSTVLTRGLAFPNGIALAPDESYAIIAETARYRLTRLWLTGEKRNLHELFLDNLPGFPDNITTSPRGTYWVALYSIRKPLLDAIHPFPFLKDTLAALPPSLRPKPIPYGMVFEVGHDGRVIRSFQDPDAVRFRDLTSAVESNGALYLGTLTGTAIGRLTP